MPKTDDAYIDPFGFREYDARWIYPKDINLEGLKRIGQGLGSQSISKTNKGFCSPNAFGMPRTKVGNTAKINKALNACKKHNQVILDKSKKSIVIQITALRRDIDKVSVKLKSLGLVSASRTGAVARTRGAEVCK